MLKDKTCTFEHFALASKERDSSGLTEVLLLSVVTSVT